MVGTSKPSHAANTLSSSASTFPAPRRVVVTLRLPLAM